MIDRKIIVEPIVESRFGSAYRELKEAELKLKSLKAAYSAAADEVLAELRDAGVKAAVVDGISVSVETSTSVTRRKGVSEDDIVNIFRSIGRGSDVRETVAPATVKKLALSDECPAVLFNAVTIEDSRILEVVK